MKVKLFLSILIMIYSNNIFAKSLTVDIPDNFYTLEDFQQTDDEGLKARFDAFGTMFNSDEAELLEFALDVTNMKVFVVYTESSKLSPKEMLDAIYQKFMRGQKHLNEGSKTIQVMVEDYQDIKGLYRMDIFLTANSEYTLSYIIRKVGDDLLLTTLMGFNGKKYDPQLEGIYSTINYD